MIVNAKCATKNPGTYLIFSTFHLFVPTISLSTLCHYTSYLTCHTIRHICARILLIFRPFLKTKTGSTRCKHSKCSGGDVRIRIIGNEQVQTGPSPLRHVKNSRSATATERNWDVTETFLSVWTSPFNYKWENFTERWRSVTERKCDV
jgi:hypothetical protein